MMQQFQFELVSPEKKIMSENVTMAVIPGTEGDFGVLSGHAPLISSIRTGIVEIYRENMNDKSEQIFIAGGFADVTGESCTILAEQAINVRDISRDDISNKLAQAKEDLELAEGIDKRRFEKRIEVYKAMHQAAAA